MKFSDVKIMVLFILKVSYFPIEGARILAVLPIYARSHHTFSQSVLKTLARAGHEVVVYSPFPLEKPIPNYSDVLMDNVATENEDINKIVNGGIETPKYKCLDIIKDTLDMKFSEFIESKQIQKLLHSKERYDLVVTEAFSGQDFILILGHIFNVQVIVLQSFMTNNLVNSVSGNSLSISHIPDPCLPFSNKMSFFERLYNALAVIRSLYYVYYNTYMSESEKKLKQYFHNAPPLLDMINNVSLVFVNDHLTADYPQPRTPNIISVAGVHIAEEGILPKTIQTFMDKATDGVILFSMGTYLLDELRGQEYFNVYTTVFKRLKQRVLWKTAKENIQGLSDNVMAVKWVPQRDVLAHSKCVLFITHGGLLSQHEAIQFSVPVVVIPHLFDQHRNGMYYEIQDVGVQLNLRNLTENNVLAAIRKVINKPKYKTNMKILSQIFRDRPMTPAQTVVYWTEYVLRHGASHLRPASTQLSWYQLVLLDVLAVILAVLVTVIGATYCIIRLIYELK